MLAIDTNVVVRYLTGDHLQQSAKAKALIAGHDVFVATTVLLESEWVLRSAYGFSGAAVAQALAGFAGLARVQLEDAALAARALGWAGQGMDFADALHLAKAEGCEAFVTFDRRCKRCADSLGGPDVRMP